MAFSNSTNDPSDRVQELFDFKRPNHISLPRAWIEAYGCSANVADSQAIAGDLSANGFRIAELGEEHDLNIIVTCSVKDATEHKMMSRIKALSKTGKPLIVAGCLAKTETKKIQRQFSGVSFLGPRSLSRALASARAAIRGETSIELEDADGREKLSIPRVRINPVVSIVQIATGCLSECSFCQTKLAKGQITSYRIGDILRAIEKDTTAGSREIWLSSTDNGCYGYDIGTNIVELLKRCRTIPGDFMIRIGMMNPMYLGSLKEPMIQLLEESDRFYRFLHIPVQSGSERVLRSMKRGHNVRMYKNLVKTFRDRCPDITIATDIIVGFPGESESDFEDTLDLISDTKPDIVNCSRYSARGGTAAKLLKGRLSTEVAKERSTSVHELAAKVSQMRNVKWIDWSGSIIIDEIGQDFIQGRNYAYKPVFIKNGGASRKDPPNLGDRMMVRIKRHSSLALEAVPQD